MKLEYDVLISPYPFYLPGVGHIKSPKLSEIFQETYRTYTVYVYYLSLDLQSYRERAEEQGASQLFSGLTEEEISQLTLYDLIGKSPQLQKTYCDVLSFFLTENVVWNDEYEVFFTYTEVAEDGSCIPSGMINRDIWNDLCDLILQRCGMAKDKTKETKPKFKSKLAEEIWMKTHKSETHKKEEDKERKNYELPNVISAVAAFDESLNMVNIWELTVYQVFDQFKRIRENVIFNISATSVAAYGDKDGHFDPYKWHEAMSEN